jgi:hypothetical protein
MVARVMRVHTFIRLKTSGNEQMIATNVKMGTSGGFARHSYPVA